jgi:hypothetical protein
MAACPFTCQQYSILQIDREAAELMCEKLKSLKAFLQDIDMLRR